MHNFMYVSIATYTGKSSDDKDIYFIQYIVSFLTLFLSIAKHCMHCMLYSETFRCK